MPRPPCAVCGQRVLWTSAFLFEQEVLMHARCWPPLSRLLKQGDEVRGKSARERILPAAAHELPELQEGYASAPYHSDGERRWVTTRCAECGWVETTRWIGKQPPQKERRGKPRGQE
jgi:hypothetical protein